MTVSRGNYNIYQQLTSCRVADTANLAGVYFNGPSNDGVKATLTASAPAALTIDSVDVAVGDSVLLAAQTNAWENGIYIVLSAGSAASVWQLQRRNDFQCSEQVQAGFFIPIAAGAVEAGAIYMVTEPLPINFGIDDLVLVNFSSGSNFIATSNAAGQTVTAAETSATPSTVRALRGLVTDSATVMVSGNLVGLRGEADVVGASGGFIYGVQGKVIPTGTLSGSVWVAGVFGQFDLSAPAVINGAQLASIWGDWGATGGTATDLSGCRGIAFTNTTSNVLNAQDYRYGNATYLLELAGAGGTLNYYLAAGTSGGSAGDAAHCAAQKVIKIEINGVAAYIPVFTQNT